MFHWTGSNCVFLGVVSQYFNFRCLRSGGNHFASLQKARLASSILTSAEKSVPCGCPNHPKLSPAKLFYPTACRLPQHRAEGGMMWNKYGYCTLSCRAGDGEPKICKRFVSLLSAISATAFASVARCRKPPQLHLGAVPLHVQIERGLHYR